MTIPMTAAPTVPAQAQLPGHSTFRPVNVVAIDQEQRKVVAVVNGAATFDLDPATFAAALPDGGGYVVGDANVWSIRNPRSASQCCWATHADRDLFLAQLEARGYRAIVVANKLANSICALYEVAAADAVRGLHDYVHDKISTPRPGPALTAPEEMLPCGCAQHWAFDSGHTVRPSRGDISHGQRAVATLAFLRLQNDGGYASPFARQALEVAWEALDQDGRKAFGFQVRTPAIGSPAKIMALAACTHDPDTGALRTHNGQPWGRNFIIRHVIGLNGTMRGTGEGAPGNPMRAVLRVRGIRSAGRQHPIDRDARAALDRHIRTVLTALQQHTQLGGPAS